jgi:hypothetical protein
MESEITVVIYKVAQWLAFEKDVVVKFFQFVKYTYFSDPLVVRTRLKRLPVISREHSTELVPTTFLNTYFVSQILALKKRQLVLQIPIGISYCIWYSHMAIQAS